MASRPPAGGMTTAAPFAEASLINYAIFYGVLAFAAEHSILLALRFGLGHPETWVVEYVWLGLIAYALMFGGTCAILQAVTRARRLVQGALAALAAVCPLLAIGSLADAASVVLAIGVGVQVARLPDRARRWLDGVVRRRALLLGAVAGATFLVAAAWYPVRERIALAQLPAARPNAPNILLLVLDTVRASEMSVYGFERPTTERLEKLAGEGVRFDRAMSTAPWTLASHISMFSGVFPHSMARDIEAVPGKALDRSFPVLAEVLATHGYATGAFSANLSYVNREWDFDRGFVHFEDYPRTVGGFVLSTAVGRAAGLNSYWRRRLGHHESLSRKTASAINARLLQWTAAQDSRPFFAFANYFDAHEPALPPDPFRTKFVRTASTMRYNYLPFSTQRSAQIPADPNEYEAQRDLYDGAIASIDHEIGRMLQELDRSGRLKNTIVVVTSDHGEMFGEHGRLGHGYLLYQSLVRVPLLIVHRGRIPSGRVVGEPVTLADLPATILDLAGVERNGIPGRSLQRFWTEDQTGPASPVLSEDPRRNPIASIVLDRYQYIGRTARRAAELYDIEADPNQQRNLSGIPEFRPIEDRMREALRAAVTGAR